MQPVKVIDKSHQCPNAEDLPPGQIRFQPVIDAECAWQPGRDERLWLPQSPSGGYHAAWIQAPTVFSTDTSLPRQPIGVNLGCIQKITPLLNERIQQGE